MTTHEQLTLTKYDLMYESRLSKTEEAMNHVIDTCKEIKSDLRWMLGILIAFDLGLLGIMAKAFKWLT
jgi:hypothetical protein